MSDKIFLKCILAGLLLLVLQPVFSHAEKVKPLNPDCDVCPIVICYENAEARDLLGKEGKSLLLKLNSLEQKKIKIDLDGLKIVGSEKDDDDGYELSISGNKFSITINSIMDHSSIQIKTDFNNLISRNKHSIWAPEIHLRPRNAIEKNDNLESAWEKMKSSTIYQHINGGGMDHGTWNNNLKKTILYVLEALADV